MEKVRGNNIEMTIGMEAQEYFIDTTQFSLITHLNSRIDAATRIILKKIRKTTKPKIIMKRYIPPNMYRF